MYQDFLARRPMEVETYLGTPIKLATETGVRIPRTETLYAMLHHTNTVNQSRPSQEPQSPAAVHPPRLSSVPPPRQSMNGNMRGGRPPPPGMGMPPPRRGPPNMGGMPPRGPPPMNGGPRPPQLPRDPSSFEDHSLDEFSHLVLYDDPADGVPQQNGGYTETPNGGGVSSADLALKERELMLRQRELQLREQEMGMRRGGGGRRPPMPHQHAFDEEDDEDYLHPMDHRGPVPPHVDPENLDMMSITSRRNRKAPSAQQLRKNPEMGGNNNSRPGSSFTRHFGGGRNRASSRIVQEIPGMHDSLMDNPMMMYSSNRYGTVDRKEMQDESRANSMTSTRLGEYGHNGYPPPRRTSHSPGQPFPPGVPGGPGPGPGGRGMGRPGPPPDQYHGPPNGMPQGGRPSPPGMMRAPVPRHPPGQGNAVAPQQVEQQVGVSNSYPIKKRPSNVPSLTGSANASAGSGDSRTSAHIDSENSAQSSQSSLGPQQAMHVR